MLDRIIGVLRLDAATYEEIEADESATSQAAIVVAIVAVVGGLVGAGIGTWRKLPGVVSQTAHRCLRRLVHLGGRHLFRGHHAVQWQVYDGADAARSWFCPGSRNPGFRSGMWRLRRLAVDTCLLLYRHSPGS